MNEENVSSLQAYILIGSLFILMVIAIVILLIFFFCVHKKYGQVKLKYRLPLLMKYFVRKIVHIVIVGEVGTGKSSTGNTILGQKKFKCRLSCTPVTCECQGSYADRFGLSIYVIDTPGLDTKSPLSDLKRYIGTENDVIYVIALVIRPARFTNLHEHLFVKLKKCFGDSLFEHMIVVVTGKDDIEYHQTSTSKFIKEGPKTLKDLMTKCRYGYVAFDNKADYRKREQQAKLFLKRIQRIQNSNLQEMNYDDIGTDLHEENEDYEPVHPRRPKFDFDNTFPSKLSVGNSSSYRSFHSCFTEVDDFEATSG